MKYTVSVRGAEIEVELSETDSGWRARVGDRELQIDVERLGRSLQHSFLVDGRSWPVMVERKEARRGAKYVLGVRGERTEALVVDEREKAAAAFDALAGGGQSGETVVESVIPGIVNKVMVEVGDTVAPGQPLLIVEAMKMENEISCESGGVVSKIHVEAGVTVNSGDPLVTLGPEPE
ncbi:MAG: biotin/lipoyl-containing protein [Planctomycetota bacterium]